MLALIRCSLKCFGLLLLIVMLLYYIYLIPLVILVSNFLLRVAWESQVLFSEILWSVMGKVFLYWIILKWNCKNLVGPVWPGTLLGLFDCTQPVQVWHPWALDGGAGAIKPVLQPYA